MTDTELQATARESLHSARRIIVKLGSSVLSQGTGLIDDLAAQIAVFAQTKRDVLIVSSGAVALGWPRLGYAARPTQIPQLQAAAAAGQSELMKRYADALAPYGKTAAQILLTHSDLASRRRLTNAGQALGALFDAGAIPIVNENDTVSTDEIAFSDNDQLASMVVPLIRADVLFLLSDIPGVLDGAGKRISVMREDSVVGQHDATKPAGLGRGGIHSKIRSARKAAHAGAHVIIGPAREPRLLQRVLDEGEDLGTWFPPHPNTLRARAHWIAYTLRPRGVILINEGAANALLHEGASLLPVGVLGTRGTFSRGDAVKLQLPSGHEVGRGLARLGTLEVARSAGRSSDELRTLYGELDAVVVHRSDLVLARHLSKD